MSDATREARNAAYQVRLAEAKVTFSFMDDMSLSTLLTYLEDVSVEARGTLRGFPYEARQEARRRIHLRSMPDNAAVVCLPLDDKGNPFLNKAQEARLPSPLNWIEWEDASMEDVFLRVFNALKC